MNSLPERLNQELERGHSSASADRQDIQPPASDPEVGALAMLARSLQAAPPLQIDSDFAHRLEQRILAQHAALQRQRPLSRWWKPVLPRPMRLHPVLASAISLCLLFLLLGGGVLVAAANVTNPNNPLYAIKQLEQHVQGTPGISPVDSAENDLQAAYARLNALSGLADAAHAGEYRHALVAFDQQFESAARAIEALPAGPGHDRLAGELLTLQGTARRTLRGLLLRLGLPEGQATTDELGRLGDTVPHLTKANLTLPARPNGQVTISISGDDLQPGAQLLVNEQAVSASGMLQIGMYLFRAPWKGNQHPHSIGIINPDGTIAQTTTIIIQSASGNNGNGNGKGNGTGNGG